MDEMKIQTPFMKGVISKAITKLILKTLGISVSISLNDIYISHDASGNTKVHLNVNADCNKEATEKLVKELFD